MTTPWTDPYWVTITFRADGTYSSRAHEGAENSALYYGTDGDSAFKLYELYELQDDLEGMGSIDIVFLPDDEVTSLDGVVRGDDLRNIRLMGDQLEFEFFHFNEYGPVSYRLWRTGPAD